MIVCEKEMKLSNLPIMGKKFMESKEKLGLGVF